MWTVFSEKQRNIVFKTIFDCVVCVDDSSVNQVSDIYEIVHKNFKARLRDQLVKLNIQNNGGPQHGVVTTELTFYLETMRSLRVLPEKHYSNKSMDDIWVK